MGTIRAAVGRALDATDRGNYIRKMRDFLKNSWLGQVDNIVHVGANAGQEMWLYNAYELGVLWIEPIPWVFAELEKNIKAYPKQRACQALVVDVSNKTFTFNIASNGGQSSSIFDLGEHKDLWPEVVYTDRIDVISRTLDDILVNDPIKYDGLVMDVQGAELLVLKGAADLLAQFQFIKAEAADFELYKGAATTNELVRFLSGFDLVRREAYARNCRGEAVNLLFRRQK
jgi:FkbM family methyltransferase